MKLFQGKIFISSGRIVSLEKEAGSVSVISESSEKKFDNCYSFPGLTDHHGHIVGLGSKLLKLNLDACKSAEECCLLAEGHSRLEGGFLYGRGWNEQLWHSKELPTKLILDDYFPYIPVYFVRIDGHSAWVNSKALEIAGIGRSSRDPEGGMILRDKAGNANGILIDNAMNLVRKHMAEPSPDQIRDHIKAANDALLKAGIVSVHDMDVPMNYLPIFNEMDLKGELGVKVKSFISADAVEWKTHDTSSLLGRKFEVTGLKFYADGALGSRGAWLLNDYHDKPGHKGLCLIKEENFLHDCRNGLEKGLNIAAHAIGDAANRYVLDLYGNFYQKYPGRLRIEHAQIVHPTDQKRFADMGIIASIQPIHCISDVNMAEERLDSATLEYSYPWNSLYELGIKLLSGSDFPIESHNPFLGIAALTDNIPGINHPRWHQKEILSPENAIETYLKPGVKYDNNNQFKKGDDADILILPASANNKNIPDIEPIAVFTDGNLIADYRKIIS